MSYFAVLWISQKKFNIWNSEYLNLQWWRQGRGDHAHLVNQYFLQCPRHSVCQYAAKNLLGHKVGKCLKIQVPLFCFKNHTSQCDLFLQKIGTISATPPTLSTKGGTLNFVLGFHIAEKCDILLRYMVSQSDRQLMLIECLNLAKSVIFEERSSSEMWGMYVF